LEVLAGFDTRHDTPPSQTPSPRFTHSSLTRAELAPNHGWRHLFEDLAMSAGMSDTAKSYITGRSRGSSDEGYGKSDVMLAGLAREMRKIGSILQ